MDAKLEATPTPAPENPLPVEVTLAAAFYPGKQEWKAEAGNRYSPECLLAMERNWKVHLSNPNRPRCVRVD